MRLFLTLLAFAGCKHFDPDKLAAVCDGSGYELAGDAPAVVATVKQWVRTPTWTLDVPRDVEPAHAGRVLCIAQAAGAFDRDCPMDTMDTTMELGNGDPKVEVHARPGAAKVVKAYAAHYTLTLRDARTAKVLAQKTIDAPVEHCPLLTLGDDLADYAELPDDALRDFMRAAPAR